MGRFSCFYGHSNSHKHKKLAQPSFETMMKTLQLDSRGCTSAHITSLQPIAKNDADHVEEGTNHATMPSSGWKSGELKCGYNAESNSDFVGFRVGSLKRSLSEGCEMDQKGWISADSKNDCIDLGFSCDGSQECEEVAESSAANDSKSHGTTHPDQNQEHILSVSPHLSFDVANEDSVFFVSDQHYLEKEGYADADVSLYITSAARDCDQTTEALSQISNSYSMPNFEFRSPTSPGVSPHASLSPQNKSFENLTESIIKEGDVFPNDSDTLDNGGLDKQDESCESEKLEGENAVMEDNDSCNYDYANKDWILPEAHEMDIRKYEQEESSRNRDHFPSKDFKSKFIEDWVLNIEPCSPLEESNEIADAQNEERRAPDLLDIAESARAGSQVNPGLDVAKRYTSSLSAATTSAQLANHGFDAIPFLSAFVSLKVLNLSGNSIVRITAGSLPRGLHVLNLSKNKISTIEGLRELTRLRSLDISYNKISRIGHGLASCASLKELYLAGNKISEVEGLHRLLKLTVLDLRFNKIATSKGLGQLAANYNSLQAISLEGNPAQRNVGDDQLKKYLQGLLPHLAYYNQHQIKSSTLKDSSDRSVRLGISAHKPSSSARHGSGLKRSSSSCSHGQKGLGVEPPKQSRGRHGILPLSGTSKPGQSHHHRQLDTSNRLQSLRVDPSIHKSSSAGNLSGL